MRRALAPRAVVAARSRSPAVRERAPARQLLDQPPHRGVGLGRPRRRPLHPRPGGDPDVPGARPVRRRGARAQAGRGRASGWRSRRRPPRARCGPRARRAQPPARAAGGLRTTRLELPLTRGGAAPAARWRCATARSRGASAGTRSWRGPVTAPRCARACPPADPDRRPAPLPAGRAVEPRRRARRDASRSRPATARVDGARRRGSVGERRRGARRRALARVQRRRRRPGRAASCCCSTAFGWGALHALSPGHGKAMVAAYLVGTRGTRAARRRARRDRDRHPHRGRVRARPGRARRCRAYVLPEDLYPWLNLLSGLLVVGVGGERAAQAPAAHGKHAHHHHHHHDHDHGHSHAPPSSSRGAASSRWARRPA